ncbi:hypothetical protein [Ruania alba]|nr:hypothetical protein [Ruania alba]
MLTNPNYLWETTDASDILARVTPETLTNMEEYVGFAGDHVDTWRLLWETALESVSSGDPTAILEALEVTENINTLESLSSIVSGGTGDGSGADGLIGGLANGDLLGGGSSEGADGGSSVPTFSVDQAGMEVIPAADTPDGVGEQVRMTIPVTNSGAETITSLVAESDAGEVTCEAETLEAGQSTTCSITVTPAEGENTVNVTFGSEGDSSSVGSFQFTFTFTGTTGTDGTDGSGTLPTDDLVGGLPTGDLLGGLPTGDLLGGLPTGDLLGGLPTGDLLGGLPTDGLPTDGLPTDDLVGGLPTDDLIGGLPTGDLLGSLPTGDLLGGGSSDPTFSVDEAGMEVIPAADTPDGVGEQVRMTIPVTNSGAETITSLVAESDAGEVTCEAETLEAGQSTTCSITVTPAEGENTVNVTFGSESGPNEGGVFEFSFTYNGSENGNDGGSGTAHFTVTQPTVEVIAAGETPDGVGEQITMAIPVTNNGSSSVELAAQSEAGEVTCEAETLEAGQSTTCSVTFTPTEGANAVTVTFADEADTSKVTTYRFVCNYTVAAGTGASHS